MSLTGTQQPVGTTNTQEDPFLEGGPNVWFEDRTGNYAYNPDSDGFYWGLSGTSTYPAFQVGCYENFHFMDNVDVNDVRCDTQGVVRSIQHRNYLDIKFDLSSMFPLSFLRHYLKGGGSVTTNATDKASKFGMGAINNNTLWKVFFSLVYDVPNAAYLAITLHKAAFLGAWDWGWNYGKTHSMTLTMRAYADTTRPVDQRFATVIRVDPNVTTP